MSEQTKDKAGRPTAVGSEHEDAEVVRRLGRSLVHSLFSASKTIQLHDLTNRAARRALSHLHGVIEDFLGLEDILSLRVTTDFVNVNGVRVNVDSQNFGPFRYMMDELRNRDVEGIDFERGVDEDEVGRFLKCFFQDIDKDQAFDTINSELAAKNVESIKIIQWVDREVHLRDVEAKISRVKDVKNESNQVFFRTVSLVGEVLKGIERRRAIQFRKAERLTQQMVDIIQEDESILIGLSSIKVFDEYTFAHSVNVSILSMLIGDRLGLQKGDIARLGVAGLLHDIGKTYVPQSILSKPGKLDEQEWGLMKYHTVFGAVELSRSKALREIADALFVAMQHHVHYNMNGYPQREGGWNLRLFSRIITVADYFDAMTTTRIYQDPLTPDKALRFIVEKSGEVFDPFLAKVFVRAMGVYPVGTIVKLSTGEKAVVIRQNEDGIIHRPVVVLLEDGVAPDESEHVDLNRRRADGRFYSTVEEAFYDKDTELLKTRFFVSQ